MDNTGKPGILQREVNTVPSYRSFRSAQLIYKIGKKLKFGIIILTSVLIFGLIVGWANLIESNSGLGFEPVGTTDHTGNYYTVAYNEFFNGYKSTFGVNVNVMGETSHEFSVPMLTVGEVVSEYLSAEYLHEDYEIILPLDTVVDEGLEIIVNKVDWKEYVTDAEVDFEIEYVDVQTIPKGKEVVVQTGENAQVTRTMKDKYVNGEYDSSIIADEIVNKPSVSKVIYRGVGGEYITPRGVTYEYSYYVDVTATAYGVDTGYGGDGDFTSTGKAAKTGVIAVDPEVIPLGSKLYVVSDYMEHGVCYAEDIGGAIKGNHIDVHLGDDLEAQLAFGRRTARVYILE